MALIFCTECGTQVSDKAQTCLKCGNPISALNFNKQASINTVPNQNFGNSFSSLNANFAYPKASLSNRFFASLLDGLIVILLSIPSILTFVFAGFKEREYNRGDGQMTFFMILFFAFLLLIIPLYYSFIKDGRGYGQSIGKKACGLMVVNLTDNSPCSKGKSFLRAFISSIPYLQLIDILLVFITSNGRKLGDFAATTQVINVMDYKENK